MAVTFDPKLTTQRDHIRLALGDKNTDNALIEDETIDAKLELYGYCEALAQLAEALIAEYGQRPDNYSESNGIKVGWGSRIPAWKEIVRAARAGEIKPPTSTRTRRRFAAVGTLTKQAEPIRNPRPGSQTISTMDGFRSD